MADPIIPDHYRAMVVFRHPSGLPEHRFVNTWYFRGDGIGTHPAVHDNILAVLRAFYFEIASTGNQIAGYMPSDLIAGAELRTYELVEAPPRTPIITDFGTLVFSASAPYPAEVASVLSYRTTRKGPRGRGRLYLGPLTATAGNTSGGWTRPSATFMQTVTNRAENVLNTTQNVTWVGLSRMDGQTYEVQNGYVDNAFDTMRKRGPESSSRIGFGGYVLAAEQELAASSQS